MQQILETQTSRATFLFLSGNLTPLSTSSALICSTESDPLPAAWWSFGVSSNWNCIYLRRVFFFLFSFSSERAERLLVRFITCAVALAARVSLSSSSGGGSSRVFTGLWRTWRIQTRMPKKHFNPSARNRSNPEEEDLKADQLVMVIITSFGPGLKV